MDRGNTLPLHVAPFSQYESNVMQQLYALEISSSTLTSGEMIEHAAQRFGRTSVEVLDDLLRRRDGVYFRSCKRDALLTSLSGDGSRCTVQVARTDVGSLNARVVDDHMQPITGEAGGRWRLVAPFGVYRLFPGAVVLEATVGLAPDWNEDDGIVGTRCAFLLMSYPVGADPIPLLRRLAEVEVKVEEERRLLDLPADVLQHIVVRIASAHHIARVAPTCKVVSVAARNALKAMQFSSEVVALAGHADWVLSVAVAPDGRLITGSDDRTVKMWCDGACERTIQAHADCVSAVAVLPGGARFVSVSHDHTAKLWTPDGDLERTFRPGDRVNCVAALPDGVHFVVGLGDGADEDEYPYNGEVRLYHVDGTLVDTFRGHDGVVLAVAVTPDGQHIISNSTDWYENIRVWSVATKSCVSAIDGHSEDGRPLDCVRTVAAMPDGQRFLSGSDDKSVCVWLLNGTFNGTLENEFMMHTGAVNSLVALPDNQHALSASYDDTVKLFNVNDGTVLRTFKHHTRPIFTHGCLALLPDGLHFVSAAGLTACIACHGLALTLKA